MKRLIIAGRVLAILTIIVGIALEIISYLPVSAEWPDTVEQRQLVLSCGYMMLLCGILFLMLLRRVERHAFLLTPMATIGIFTGAYGCFAVSGMLANIGAWAVLSLGLGLFWITIGIRAKHRKL